MNPLTEIPAGDPIGVAVGVIIGFCAFATLFVLLWRQQLKFYREAEAFHKSATDEREADVAQLRKEREEDNERFRKLLAEQQAIADEQQATIDELRIKLASFEIAQKEWHIERMDLERRHATEVAKLTARILHLEQLLEERA